MRQIQEKGFPLVGVVFLALGVFKLIQGDDWVVWFILGVVFGGLGWFSRRRADSYVHSATDLDDAEKPPRE